MKKIWILQLTLLLTLVLIAGCRMRVTPSESDAESAENADQETICGVITHINGNELELELMSMGGTTGAPGGIAAGEQSASGELEAGESSSSLTAVEGGRFSGGSASGKGFGASAASASAGAMSGRRDGQAAEWSGGSAPAGGDSIPEGFSGGREAMAGGGSLKLTGESMAVMVPVGTPVYIGTGESQKVRDFNSLQKDYIVILTMRGREDGTRYLASVQIYGSI